jgi:hypothetical protein
MGTSLVISSNTTGCAGSGVLLSISGAQQLVLSNNATITEAVSSNFSIGIGYYRMIGAIYTTSAMTPTIVPFTQTNDTFYLDTPVRDVPGTTISDTLSTPTTLTLASVPNGLVVEALGRCESGTTGSGQVILYTPNTAPGLPTAFTNAPGYSVQASTTAAFPYRLHTNASQTLDALASTTGTVLNCITDGWVFDRTQ